MKFVEATGKTVDIAVENGLKEIGLLRNEVDIEILAQGGGLLKKARVKLTKKKTPGEKSLGFIEGLMEALEMTAAVEMEENAGEARFNIIGTDTRALIGRRGETLDAIQYIASVLANSESAENEHVRIIVDTDGYRAKREQELVELAHKFEERAEKTGRKVILDPMNPSERRIIHAALGESKTVTTKSEGYEPQRYIVIIPKNMKKTDDRPSGGFNRDKNKKGFQGKHYGGNRRK